MKKVLFEVKSDRAKTIALQDNVTVGALRRMLCESGYDVANAVPVLFSSGTGLVTTGLINDLVLGDGDEVKFLTKDHKEVCYKYGSARVRTVEITPTEAERILRRFFGGAITANTLISIFSK